MTSESEVITERTKRNAAGAHAIAPVFANSGTPPTPQRSDPFPSPRCGEGWPKAGVRCAFAQQPSGRHPNKTSVPSVISVVNPQRSPRLRGELK